MLRLRMVTGTLVVALLAALFGAPAVAEPPPAGDVGTTEGTTRVIGGRDAGPREFPYMAAVLYASGNDPYDDLLCGATVLSPSYVLTAAHCVVDRSDLQPDTYPGPGGLDYVGPEDIQVLTGVSDLGSGGGQRLPVASIHPHPSSTGRDNDFDFAVLRLGRPTTAPGITLVGAGEERLQAPGVLTTTAGWGWTGNSYPTQLRTADLRVIADDVCARIYPEGRTSNGSPTEYRSKSMLCVGDIAGGTDSCRGDSGGPLIGRIDGSARLLGVVSWGDGCAQPNLPGVYAKVSAARAWIEHTRRFGPFDPDSVSYVVRQYLDLAGRWPTIKELDKWVMSFAAPTSPRPADLPLALMAAPAWADVAPPVARLYRATFLRNPDTPGFKYWLGPGRVGRSITAVADHFAHSPEFVSRYGSLDAGAFTNRIYQNVFGRAPDTAGRAYWRARLDSGTSRGTMLALLSDSAEYRSKTASEIDVVTTWYGMLRAVPTAAQIRLVSGLQPVELVDHLRHSYQYAARFNG